ncbi:hypothetical protein [Butyrivibrio sp. INlla14]|uniref:hypothetical protein n=1 Tax=Butyrivibrio sp. INlla14 TaxID=1520808 RepID=UPI001FA7E416|nr:hypothetical protein [Butyrivibrio sp. INlla14]
MEKEVFYGNKLKRHAKAWVYHGGKSEVAAREALVKRYPRDSFMLATKLPAWEIKKESDVDRTNPVVRSEALYNILHKRNIPIVVMEPVRGGTADN